MPKKGKVNNPRGRPAGSQNKTIAPIREKFNQLLDGYTIEQMLKDLRSLEPKERLTIVGGLAEYVIPKLGRTEVKNEGDQSITIKVIRE